MRVQSGPARYHKRHAALKVLLVKQEDPAPLSYVHQIPSTPCTAEPECTQLSCLAVRRSEDEVGALRQVAVDVPRTAPGVAFFHEPAVQKCLERILYIWGVRCPA